MSTLWSAGIQDSSGENLASQSDQLDGLSDLRPFSEDLRVDEKLKLRRENWKQSIENFYNDKNITPLSQLTATPAFPTPHVLAQFASKTYKDYKTGETDAQYEKRLALPDGWKLLTTASNASKTNGYFGAAYWHPEHQQVVIAHRGTKLTNIGAVWTDLFGVVFENHVSQMNSASTFALQVVEVLREFDRVKGVSFQLFFTGHSLGGWLAQVTTFSTEYLKREGKIFLRITDDSDCYHPHTVVFESPGCKNMLLKMTDEFDVRLDGLSIDIEHLDITSYLSAPNRINTCNPHVGTVYRIFTDISDMGWWKKRTALYNLAAHSKKNILQAFDSETGQVRKDEQGQLKVQTVVDWPINVVLKGDNEYKKFFEWAKHLNNYHPHIKDEAFQLLHSTPIRYQTKLCDRRVIRFSTFSEVEREFLQNYRWLREWPEFCKPKELFSEIEGSQAQEVAAKLLQSFEIQNDTIRCTDASTLQALIPYVKRLLQLFPEIKEKTKRALLQQKIRYSVYQFETRRYIEQIKQSPLQFNTDVTSYRKFVETEQEKVLHLQMFEVDEWAGLIKVYQSLQKAGCLSEGQYTILKLKHLLTVNHLIELGTLMQSTLTLHLLLIACEDNQQLDKETKDVIQTLFETIKGKPNIKIIFTTRSGSSTVAFLNRLCRTIPRRGFVRRNEHLKWSDLTTSSQEKLLEKSVKFQGSKIPLKELMSAESPAANFLPLGALLEEKEPMVADPVPTSNDDNKLYYIGRTLRHEKAIKQDILKDKDVTECHVYLASTEQEYKKICEIHPTRNVHWVEKEKSGKLVWQQSQGSLETVRRYTDTKSSLTYTADDLDKLLEQAQHQSVMLISDTAGMGKSTVLTHLSKEIKQNFPAKWVVRLDLNDHTDALNELKKERIGKVKTIEFLSEKLLKLKPGLELELFKQCCEKKQKVRIVIMLDGFDEISPFYKETVIDLLQALRQTAVEQLWVTTRPNLREELEDKLQQLSYTLEPFSEGNQVEFLTKFWSMKDWFTEPSDKGEEIEKGKLEIYAEMLIKKLSETISDKDREFTGIPLQTRMLAEAFDKDVQIYYESADSKPEISHKLDLLGLYEIFLDRKYDIYQEEKIQVSVNNAGAKEQRKYHLKGIRMDHQLMALKMLFNAEQVSLLQNNKECSFSDEELTRIGVVQIDFVGKPHFIHRTFAEYYVADCLVNHLTEGNNTSQQLRTFILKDIFLEDDYRVIRVFVDAILSRTNGKLEVLKQYGNQIQDLRTCDDLILCNAALEGNVNIIEFLLASVQASDHTDKIKEMLLAEDEDGFTAWIISVVSNNTQVLEKLWEWAEKKLTAEELKNEMLFARVAVKENYLSKPTQPYKIRDQIMTWRNKFEFQINGRNLNYFLKEKNTVWHLAAHMGNLKVLEKLWQWVKEKLSPEEIIKLLLAKNEGRTVWYLAADGGNIETLEKVWVWAERYLTTSEIIYNFLLGSDKMGWTAWHLAVWEGNVEVFHKICEWAEEKLTTEEIKNRVLLRRGLRGKTAWHLAAVGGNIGLLHAIYKWAEGKLTREGINNGLLLGTDYMRRTALHMAAENGNIGVLHAIREWAKEKLTTEEINKLLLCEDYKRMTAWQLAAEKGNVEVLLAICEWAEEKLTTEEIKNKLLLGTSYMGRTAWQLAVREGNLQLLHKIWEWAEVKLTTEEINDIMLLGTDREGKTALHLAAENGNVELLHKIWEWAEENLTTEEIKNKLLLGRDNMGKTAWNLAAEKGYVEVLHTICELAEEKLTTEEINNEMLLARDVKGMNLLNLVPKKGNPELLHKIWEWAEEKLAV